MDYETFLFRAIYALLAFGLLTILYLAVPMLFVLLGIAGVLGLFTFGVRHLATRAGAGSDDAE